jgi:hypothetical protein
LLEGSKAGHLVEMRVPEEIPALHPAQNSAPNAAEEPPASAIEATDFLKTWRFAKPFTTANAAPAFIASAALLAKCSASITSCPALSPDAILPQPGFLLHGMQFSQGRPSRPGPPAQSLPPRTPHPRRTHRATRPAARPRRWQAPPHSFRPRKRTSRGFTEQQRPTTARHKTSGWRGKHTSFDGGDSKPDPGSSSALL